MGVKCEGCLAAVGPEFELHEQRHGGELFAGHAADLEDTEPTGDSAVAFAFTAQRIDDRFENAGFGLAAWRLGLLGSKQASMAASGARTLGWRGRCGHGVNPSRGGADDPFDRPRIASPHPRFACGCS